MRPKNFNKLIAQYLLLSLVFILPIMLNSNFIINLKMLPINLNPIKDIDLTTSTDFEDSFILVLESFELYKQDTSIFADGGFVFGTSYNINNKNQNIMSIR